MTGIVTALGRLFSRGDAGISVPAMDGVFKPNNRLETAERIATVEHIDNLVPYGDGLAGSDDERLLQLPINGPEALPAPLETFPAPISFVAASEEGTLAVGLNGVGVLIGVPGGWKTVEMPGDLAACMTAATFLPDGGVAICIGSRINSSCDWKRDLMERGSSGCVLRLDTTDGTFRTLADGLGYPNGLVMLGNGELGVGESWRHRILSVPLDGSGPRDVLLDNLPAYPSRLAPATDGGVWMALFAPRRQLFEMVLREDDYRREMIDTIEPDEWIGPELSVSNGPDQPLQQGSVRQMGILKPWAPSRSYGLVVLCDSGMRPRESWHSRADGTVHGITSICEIDAGVFAASRGSGRLLRLGTNAAREGAEH